jgi:hypothetical protein
MKKYFYKAFLFSCFITILCCNTVTVLAQKNHPNNNCTEPSEGLLQRFLRQIKSENKHHRLKIGGIVKGAFTTKDQVDYVFWLNEQKIKGTGNKRQIIKLVCKDNDWEIGSVGWLPAGIIISKDNFIDVTGDQVLEFWCNYSYMATNCVDGCAVFSLQGKTLQEIHYKKEERSCQNIDFSNYGLDTELPFVSYLLQFKDLNHDGKTWLVEQRLVKKYNGGTYNNEVLELAKVDTITTLLEHDEASNTFQKPIVVPCNSQALAHDNLLNARHPAIRLITKRLNKNKPNQFHIESVYKATLSQKDQVEFLFCSNKFTNIKDNLEKRKIVKVVCDGEDWKIVGIMYVNASFSEANIKDVDGDGIDEIINKSKIIGDSSCTRSYRILSFKGVMGKVIYSHQNTYTSCNIYDVSANSTVDGEIIGIEYTIAFEDVDNDGQIEIVRTSSSKEITKLKYSEQNQRFVPIK